MVCGGHRDWELQDKDCVKFKQTSRPKTQIKHFAGITCKSHLKQTSRPNILGKILEYEMKISSFEASLIRNIKFSMVIFLASIVWLNGHKSGHCNTNVGQIFRKCKNNRHAHVHLLINEMNTKKTGVIPCFTILRTILTQDMSFLLANDLWRRLFRFRTFDVVLCILLCMFAILCPIWFPNL